MHWIEVLTNAQNDIEEIITYLEAESETTDGEPHRNRYLVAWLTRANSKIDTAVTMAGNTDK